MRDPEDQRIALDCLDRAVRSTFQGETTEDVVARAASYYAFVTGASDDDAKSKLALVRKAVS